MVHWCMDEEYLEEEQNKDPDVSFFRCPETDVTFEMEGMVEHGIHSWDCGPIHAYHSEEDGDVLNVQVYADGEFHDDVRYGEGPLFYYALINIDGKWGFAIILNEKWCVQMVWDEEEWEEIYEYITGEADSIKVTIYYNPDVEPSCTECDEYHIESYVNPIEEVHFHLMDTIDEHFGGPVPPQYIEEEEEARQELLKETS